DVLDAGPGQTAAEVREVLRGRGRVSLTTADVARVLVATPGRFHHDGGDPRRWWTAARAPGRPPVPRDRATGRGSWHGPPLYAWQADALAAWRGRGGRGVVEAVTGTGKTMVGVAAACEELSAGGQVCVVVPTLELLAQWRGVLDRHLPGGSSVGLLGGGHHDRLGSHDVLVAVVNSARRADLVPRRPGGLLVADECHRYGSDGNRLALEAGFARRLGLSATYARADDGNLTWLDPYFGGTCFRMGYERAIADGVTARFRVALVGVRFSEPERDVYEELCFVMAAAKAQLVLRELVPPEPVGAFFEAVARLARGGGDGPGAVAARRYLRAVQERRALLAETPAKAAALRELVPALRAADRAIVFTQSIAAAEGASATVAALGLSAGAVHSGQDARTRRAVLAGFAAGAVQVVAAPQVLDEGVDVPAADLAVILAASRSRRQMVQRMGRVLRRKPDGRPARFVVVSVEGTVEDPAGGAHEGFLSEITTVADA
ncbi:MAG: DEAD/DEAH box helicase, partial [Acidimicrobiales bacterium]